MMPELRVGDDFADIEPCDYGRYVSVELSFGHKDEIEVLTMSPAQARGLAEALTMAAKECKETPNGS